MSRSTGAGGGARGRATDRIVAGYAAVLAVSYGANAFAIRSVALGYALLFGLYVVGVGLAWYRPALRPLVVAGTVAGVLELGADAFLVRVAGVLVYPSDYPALLDSPAYMPFAWAIALTQMGYLATRLDAVSGRRAAVLGTAAVAGPYFWFFETTAADMGLWTYANAPGVMLRNVPLFVVLAEVVMMGILVYALDRPPVRAGALFGATIAACYVGAYYVVLAVASLA